MGKGWGSVGGRYGAQYGGSMGGGMRGGIWGAVWEGVWGIPIIRITPYFEKETVRPMYITATVLGTRLPRTTHFVAQRILKKLGPAHIIKTRPSAYN